MCLYILHNLGCYIMATKKKTNTKPSAKTKKKTEAESTATRQLYAVVWFAVAIFMAFVVFIKGQNLWTSMHNFMFSIFGTTAYIYPFLIGAIAILCATDSNSSKVNAKTTEAIILILFVGAFIDIIATPAADFAVSGGFSLRLSKAWALEYIWGGGALGALLGFPLGLAFGKTGAIIILVLLLFVSVMILTGTRLGSLFKIITKPAKAVSEQVNNAYERSAQEAENGEQDPKKKRFRIIKGFDVDIPVEDPEKPEKPKKRKQNIEEMQQKLVESYHGKEIDKKDIAEDFPPADDNEIDNALDAAQEEADENTPERMSVDFEKETDAVANEIAAGVEVAPVYKFPPVTLLENINSADSKTIAAELETTSKRLVETLQSFGVETKVVNVSRGPTVTRYELQPKAGVKISKITNLADDIALNLATAGVRIEAPIPNKAAVGIEVPNRASATVGVREIIESSTFTSSKSKLTVSMGKDIGGNTVVADIAKMPHGLIAGATGSGKSVCINSFIISLLYKASPEDVKLLMIDPKVVELGIYNGIPHLLVPVVTEPRKAAGALGWAVNEMEQRYKMFADRDVRNIEGYNKLVETLVDEPEVKKMPRIVIIIDELADLMMTAPKEVEDSINRIAAKARAAGIHLLIATQRPSVNVVTGVIKANIPTRIAFAVSSHIDSGTILDCNGAEKLLGRGDMLFKPVGSTKPGRIQGCFVSDEEVERVVDFVKSSGKANYDDNIMIEIERQAAIEKQQRTGVAEEGADAEDPVLEDAIKVVVELGQASTSLLQRKLKLGYARAARIIDQMEERGIIGGYEGAKPRQVLITKEQLMERQAGSDD